MNSKTVTLETVAKQAGVSIKTVSRVVNNEPFVSGKTKIKVEEAIARLKFKPNQAARQLRGQRSYSLALVYEPPASEFLTSLLEGILPFCRAASYRLLLEPLATTDQLTLITQLIEQGAADGFILLPPHSEDISLIRHITDANLKVVLVGSTLDTVRLGLKASKVGIDDYSAGREVGHHLIDYGHSHIGYISLRDQHMQANQRGEGLREAMIEANIDAHNLSVIAGDSSFESGFKAAETMLTVSNPPTAIFAGNDHMAAGAIAYAQTQDISIPDDLSIVGFDGGDLSKMFVPSFMTVHQPLEDMGQGAIQILLASLSNTPSKPVIQNFEHQLIFRPSIKNLRAS